MPPSSMLPLEVTDEAGPGRSGTALSPCEPALGTLDGKGLRRISLRVCCALESMLFDIGGSTC
jgi:hypothetical protein